MRKSNRFTTANLIKEFRKSKGMSQMNLADKIGISYQQIQKYEKGINNINVERLKQIAKALEIPINEFFPAEKGIVSESPAVYGKMSDDEQTLLYIYRSIKDKKLKKAFLDFMKAVVSNLKSHASL
jgi:transcriptional regulator with XRE-family HTH domain